jgi:hypothetical protein
MRRPWAFGFPTALLARAPGGAMSDTGCAYLIEQLEQPKKAVPASIDGLTEAQ